MNAPLTPPCRFCDKLGYMKYWNETEDEPYIELWFLCDDHYYLYDYDDDDDLMNQAKN